MAGLQRAPLIAVGFFNSGRKEHRGLRLDYVVASKRFVEEGGCSWTYVMTGGYCEQQSLTTFLCHHRLYDACQLPDYMGSDHCPVVAVFVPREK